MNVADRVGQRMVGQVRLDGAGRCRLVVLDDVPGRGGDRQHRGVPGVAAEPGPAQLRPDLVQPVAVAERGDDHRPEHEVVEPVSLVRVRVGGDRRGAAEQALRPAGQPARERRHALDVQVCRAGQPRLGQRCGLVGLAGEQQQVGVQPVGGLGGGHRRVAAVQPAQRGQRRVEVAVQLGQRGGDDGAELAQRRLPVRAGQPGRGLVQLQQPQVIGAGVRGDGGEVEPHHLRLGVSAGVGRGDRLGEEGIDLRVAGVPGLPSAASSSRSRGRPRRSGGADVSHRAPVSGGNVASVEPHQGERGLFEKVGVARRAGHRPRAQHITAGEQQCPDLRTGLPHRVGRQQPAQRIHPQWMDAEPASTGAVHQRHPVRERRRVSVRWAQRGEGVPVRGAEQSQRQQQRPVGVGQPVHDLLPEEGPRDADRRGQGEPHQGRPAGERGHRGRRPPRPPGQRGRLGRGEGEVGLAQVSTRSAARSRASGAAGSTRPASTRWTCAGSRRTTSPSSAAPPEPAGSSCTSSRIRQVSTGDVACNAASTSASGSADPRWPPSARQIASASRCASSSPGSQHTHASTPRGSASCSRMAWPSTVDLPNPGPATTVVTGTSQRPARVSSSRSRSSSPATGRGGLVSRRAGSRPGRPGTRRHPTPGAAKTVVTLVREPGTTPRYVDHAGTAIRSGGPSCCASLPARCAG